MMFIFRRNVLSKSLPHLKFLDHFSLDALHSQQQPQTLHQLGHQHHDEQQQQRQFETGNEQLPSSSKDLWSKLKSFLNIDIVRHGQANGHGSSSNQTCGKCSMEFIEHVTYTLIHAHVYIILCFSIFQKLVMAQLIEEFIRKEIDL